MPPAVPVATYRLQFSPTFGFDAAASVVPYLQALGISHLYASPFLKSRPGSTHGYDVIDHNALNPELGGEAAFARLSTALAEADIGLILDFVPNHVGVGGADNAWWLDVLEWGRRSLFAASFEIDWTAPSSRGRVLLPILERPYGEALEQGEIAIRFAANDGNFSAWYHRHRLPIRPELYPQVLRTIVAAADAQDGIAGRRLLELAARRTRSREDAAALKRALAQVEGGAPVIECGLVAYRPSTGARALRALHRLLERQHYRLAHWRVANREGNYRRFFDINDLAGLRIEHPDTFAAAHHLVKRLIAEGRLHGLRLDHIDGLREPMLYCRLLERLVTDARGTTEPPFYVIAEKILGEGESMPDFPGVAGTTGYEWLNLISRLLVDERGLATLERCRAQIAGEVAGFAEILARSKHTVLVSLFASELDRLARLLARIAAGHWQSRDYTVHDLKDALQRFVLHFPFYRTYVTAEGPSTLDRAAIDRAIADAIADGAGPAGILEFLRSVLTLDLIASKRSGYSQTRVQEFALQVQQLTAPVMAKAMEDTACYRYLRLLALNDVGGDPAATGLSIDEFHERMIARAQRSPHGMTATATHDTKRGEDARARVLALSELADEWTAQAQAWSKENVAEDAEHRCIPSLSDRYLIYQALVGAWPLTGPDATFVERMQAYAVKAAREAKVATSWLDRDEAYEAALTAFIRRILDPDRSAAFIASFDAFTRRAALIGALNGLVQLAVKATMPGVPDFYQGTEFWDLTLVDPDNRRPVDFHARQAVLAAVSSAPDWQTLKHSWHDGAIKLALTRRLLAVRGTFAPLFRDGSYQPLRVTGAHRDHVLAFARSYESAAVIVAVGRHLGQLTSGGREWPHADAWRAAIVTDGLGSLRDLLAPGRTFRGDEISVADLFTILPVALLHAARCANPHFRFPALKRLDPSRDIVPTTRASSVCAKAAGNQFSTEVPPLSRLSGNKGPQSN
jgi:(1->4)-alpha-D-glucan 1-alpha-D-glucosylmutase